MKSQLCKKLKSSSPNLLCKESFHIERLFVFQHKVDSSTQFMGKYPKGFPLVVFSFKSCDVFFCLVRISEHYDSSFFNGPFQVMVPDFFIGNTSPFSIGFFFGLRFFLFYLSGNGDGHTQSLILAAILMIVGFQTFLVGIVTDLLAANRKLLEDIQYNQRIEIYGEENKKNNPPGTRS